MISAESPSGYGCEPNGYARAYDRPTGLVFFNTVTNAKGALRMFGIDYECEQQPEINQTRSVCHDFGRANRGVCDGGVGPAVDHEGGQATAQAKASAISMTSTARTAPATVRKDPGLSCPCRYVMCAGNRCVDMSARAPLIVWIRR